MNSVRLALVTWNVGGGPPGVTPGTDMLLRCARNADVIVVGLQEVSVARRGWKSALFKSLGPQWAYMGGESYAGLRLKVFAHVTRGRPVAVVTATGMKVGAGFADRWPNKGAVAVEIRFSPSCRVLFVVAHLAANEAHLIDRQDDWRAILRRLDKDAFLSRAADPTVAVPLFHRYEHIFVAGDLNYRIEAPGSGRDRRVHWVQQHVNARDWPALVAKDQLTRERLAGKVFANFQEAPINFAPTFKIDPCTGKYSTSRVPSYCDRILWHSLPARVPLVHNLRYEPLLEFKRSDHVPVLAEFQLDVPIVMHPPRAPRGRPGLRIVLEFKLVRFVKTTSSLVKRESFADDPTSIRRLDAPSGLRLVTAAVAAADPSNASPSASFELDHDDTDPHTRRSKEREERELVSCMRREKSGKVMAVDEDDDQAEEEDDDDLLSTSSSTSQSSDEDDDIVDDDDETFSSSFAERSTMYSPYDAGDDDEDDDANVPIRRRALRLSDRAVEAPSFSPNQSGDTVSGASGFDEELLVDMLSRHMSASSSTSVSSPGNTVGTSGGELCSEAASAVGQTSDGATGATRTPRASDATAAIGCGGSGGARAAGATTATGAHCNSGPRKRDSLSKQLGERRAGGQSKTRRRARLNGMRMEVHGQGLFLKQDRVYSITIPKRRNGQRERIGESLPVIALAPVARLEDLEFRHVLIEFARKKTHVGTSGALPLKEVLHEAGQLYSFEMTLTKYGQPVATLEASVQLTVRPGGCWEDSRGRVVRAENGGSTKDYRGELPVRKRTRARTKPDHGKWR